MKLFWVGLVKNSGFKFATPIFDGATIDEINEYTDKAGVPRYGKTYFTMVEPVKVSINRQLLVLSICLN
jgi:DNA-directed RNA polymerase beta subunit